MTDQRNSEHENQPISGQRLDYHSKQNLAMPVNGHAYLACFTAFTKIRQGGSSV